jgi:hypothetical protein
MGIDAEPALTNRKPPDVRQSSAFAKKELVSRLVPEGIRRFPVAMRIADDQVASGCCATKRFTPSSRSSGRSLR